MRSKKLVTALAAVGFGLALSSAPAFADVTFFNPFTQLHDDDIDKVIDNDTSGSISAGDRLVSVIEFHDSRGTLPGQTGVDFTGFELTAVADVTVVTILNGTIIFTSSGASGLLSGFAAGTTVAIFQDFSPDLTLDNGTCGTVAQCTAAAGLGQTDGSNLWATIGFFGDPDETWVSTPVNPGALLLTNIHATGSSISLGSFSFAQSLGINNTGHALDETVPCFPFCAPGGNGLVDVTGNGQILGGSGLNFANWDARSKADATVEPAIPEPGSLALLGIALAGFATLRRRK